MASYYKKLIKYLESQGCRFDREGNGSHEIWHSPITKRKFPIPSGSHCKNKITVTQICKQAGVDKPDWL